MKKIIENYIIVKPKVERIGGQDDFEKVLTKALKCSKKKYQNMSQAGIDHVNKNYNFENFENSWIELMDNLIEKHGSWENRVGYKKWHLLEVA